MIQTNGGGRLGEHFFATLRVYSALFTWGVNMELKDKVAFITGGASGLGRATAERFVQAGAKVILFDLNEENAE